MSLYIKVYSVVLKGHWIKQVEIAFCSAALLLSCNLQRRWTQTRCTTINSIQCLFSCSMWHQNANWFLFAELHANKNNSDRKKKSQYLRNKIVVSVNWLHYHEGQEGCREEKEIMLSLFFCCFSFQKMQKS